MRDRVGPNVIMQAREALLLLRLSQVSEVGVPVLYACNVEPRRLRS